MENGCGWYAEVNSFRYLELDLDARKFRRAEVWKLASVVVEVVMVWAGWVCFGSGLMRICAFFFLFFIFLRGFDRSRLRCCWLKFFVVFSRYSKD